MVVVWRGVLAEEQQEGATHGASLMPSPQPVAVADVAQQKKRTIPNNRITTTVLLRRFLTRCRVVLGPPHRHRTTERLTAREVVGANVAVVSEEEGGATALGRVVGLGEENEEGEGEEGEEDEDSLRTLTPHHRTRPPTTDRWKRRQG